VNRRCRTISDPAQGSFFDPARAPLTGAELASAIREAVSDALARAKAHEARDRYAVASEMSRLTGRDITKNMLDRYAAPSADEWRFPLEALPALIRATGDTRLVHLIAEACGFKAMPVEATAVAELVTLELEERALKKRIAAARRQLPKEALAWAAHEAERRGGK
jgi:hypothetical protein